MIIYDGSECYCNECNVKFNCHNDNDIHCSCYDGYPPNEKWKNIQLPDYPVFKTRLNDWENIKELLKPTIKPTPKERKKERMLARIRAIPTSFLELDQRIVAGEFQQQNIK